MKTHSNCVLYCSLVQNALKNAPVDNERHVERVRKIHLNNIETLTLKSSFLLFDQIQVNRSSVSGLARRQTFFEIVRNVTYKRIIWKFSKTCARYSKVPRIKES